ncbi:hypothetical protein HN873_010911, partial [Arachis hypogaea]
WVLISKHGMLVALGCNLGLGRVLLFSVWVGSSGPSPYKKKSSAYWGLGFARPRGSKLSLEGFEVDLTISNLFTYPFEFMNLMKKQWPVASVNRPLVTFRDI